MEHDTASVPRWKTFAAVKIVVALVSVAFVGLSMSAALTALASLVFGEESPRVVSAMIQCACGVAGLATYWGYVRWFEQRTVDELSPHGALREIGGGVLVGGALFSSTVAVVALLGEVRVVEVFGIDQLLIPIGFAIGSSLIEEVLFRGILFRILSDSLGTVLSLVITASLFGFIHGLNPNASAVSNIAIALEAGVLLAAVYAWSGRLWAVVGLHAAWNYTQGGIFGLAVSGRHARGVLKTEVTGPEWLTGGAFGLEASLVAVALCLLAATIALVVVYRQGRFQPPFWTRGKSKATTLGGQRA